jgi:Flp pilus assembly protein TadG
MVTLKAVTSRARSERGAELIEFALVLPLLLVLVLGIVDFGFLFQRLEVITNAAREGARMAVLSGYTTTDIEARVLDYVSTGGLETSPPGSPPNPVITVTDVSVPTGAGPTLPGKRVQVVYTSQYLFLGPVAGWFGGSFTSVPLAAVATMSSEGGGS